MRLYFAGAEIPSHRKVLTTLETPHVAVSYMGLRRRVKFAKPWIIDEKFSANTGVFLDSGAYTVNKGADMFSQRELMDISEHYQSFVLDNIDRIDMVSEFDAIPLGSAWIQDQRDEFYAKLPPHKFLPIWHPEFGLHTLTEMAKEYPRIGVTTVSLNGRKLAPLLNSLVYDHQTLLHGVAMTQVDEMSIIKWDSLSSTSWISPQQYGDTIVWTGRELKRYPKKYKAQARKRYRTLFEREGFDPEKIENDDSTELLRLSLWSWQCLVNDIDDKHNRGLHVVTPQPESHDDDFAEVEGGEVDTHLPEVRNSVSTPDVVERRSTKPIPVIGVTPRIETYIDPETGEESEREVSDVHLRSEAQRKCSTCFLSAKCPAFEPGQSCAFDIPVEIKTREQFHNLQNALIEMQAQRVLFMRFAEEQEGGYADPNLSSEIDRLHKMMKTKNDMEQEGFSFKIEAKASGGQHGQTGMLARLFGDNSMAQNRELPGGPVPVESVVDVIDADFLEDR